MRYWLPSVALLSAVMIGGRQQPVQPLKPQAPSCHVVVQSGPARDTIVVGVTDSLNQPTDAWPFIMSALFEPLVRRDCSGQYGPGVAARWTSINAGFVFNIRHGATLANGTPVTAGVIAEILRKPWMTNGNPLLDDALLSRGLPRASAFNDSVLVFPAADTSAWLEWLSNRPITIPDSMPLNATVYGTLGYTRQGRTPSGFLWTSADAGKPQVKFLLKPGADPRDLLDQGVDVIVTDDRATLEYARRNDAYDVVPLPWSGLYEWAGAPLAPAESLPALAAELATAVRVDARPVEPSDWASLPACAGDSFPSAWRGPERRVAYLSNDRIARDVASRIVALAGARRLLEPGVRAVSMPFSTFGPSSISRVEFGYVLGGPIHQLVRCAQPASGITPLIVTRKYVIVRRGVIGIDVDWYGTPHLVLQ